jgi:esterase/lipase superfamily enzyme
MRPGPAGFGAIVSRALALACLAACGGPPKGVLTPVAGAPDDAARVAMIVATTRSETPAEGEMFSGERGPALAFADISVSIPPETAREIGEVQWPRKLPPNPATDFATLKAERITKEQAVARFRESVADVPGRRVLVFVHGFNNRFEDAVYRFAQIAHDSEADAVPVLFTWPSRGSVLAYGYDRESTNYSRDALEEVLAALARSPQVGEVSILAHSMGNWLTLEALRQMAIRDGRIPAKIENVMMAAPDVDVDVFGEMIARMGEPRPSFTLFVSQDDRALAVSRKVWGSTARLGAIDPEVEPYRTELSENAIQVIDLTKLDTGDPTHHAKFAESPEIVRSIGARLAEGQTMTDSRVGLGEQIVQATTGLTATVGTAAGLVLAAPVAVVDPATRENYGSHVGQLGAALPGTGSGAVAAAPAGCAAADGVSSPACPD